MDKAEKELQTEFIPDLYDKTMETLFDQKYYDASDDDKALGEDKEVDMQLLNDRVGDIGGVQDDSDINIDLEDVDVVQDAE